MKPDPCAPPKKCRCGHGAEWHANCSLCKCPFYLSIDEHNAKLIREWEARRQKENQT